ncbi:MAG: carbamoyltransferase [bacterium]
MSKRILGISAFYHDSAAAILHDDRILGAAQEARFSRNKHDSTFPVQSIQYCLEESGNRIDDLDAVVFYDKPFRKFERLLETYYAFAPSGLRSFLSAIPVWIKEKLFQKKLIKDELNELQPHDTDGLNLLFTEHHQSHAASAFYPSPFESAAVLTLDGVGEWATTALSAGQGNDIEILEELHFPHSIGLLYSSFTYFLGFKVNSGEYKLMGLAPYGNPESSRVDDFETRILEELIDLKDDGSFAMDQEYFSYTTGLRMVEDEKWESLFGIERRQPESDFEQVHCDMALAIQNVTEKIIFRLARTLRDRTGESNLCLAGGVALNCVANGKLLKKDIFEDVWIQPAAGDAGGSLGAAYAVYHNYFDQPRTLDGNGTPDSGHTTPDSRPSTPDSEPSTPDTEPSTHDSRLSTHDSHPPNDKMQGTFLGPRYSGIDIRRAARQFNASYSQYSELEELCALTAEKIADGNIIGWFQGRMEWGPRALGNRSILGDPRDNTMQEKINRKIKYRESFRPFAPSVLAEDAEEYFDLGHHSPYMVLIGNVLEGRREELPDDYHDLSPREKLQVKRSDIPAVTHLDFTSRFQTVHRETNPRYHKLLTKFKDRTGYGVVVNTSFNLRGEPIVRTPAEAYRCFMRSKMDYLVMGNYVFDRDDQPEWPETREEWRKKIDLD